MAHSHLLRKRPKCDWLAATQRQLSTVFTPSNQVKLFLFLHRGIDRSFRASIAVSGHQPLCLGIDRCLHSSITVLASPSLGTVDLQL